MFYNIQQQTLRDKYINLLTMMGSLSNLFSIWYGVWQYTTK